MEGAATEAAQRTKRGRSTHVNTTTFLLMSLPSSTLFFLLSHPCR